MLRKLRKSFSTTDSGESAISRTPRSPIEHGNTTSQTEKSLTRLISVILENPVAFMFGPHDVAQKYRDEDFADALDFFSVQSPERYVYGISTALFSKREPQLNSRLVATKISEFSKNRYWPFWHAHELRHDELGDFDLIEHYLLDLWNDSSSERWTPKMFYQTGRLVVERRLQFGKIFFFRCGLPVRQNGRKKPDSIIFAFDQETKGFYTLNARVRFEEPEHRFRFIEFIGPNENPPNVEKTIGRSPDKQCKVILVLDRHIGDNLSLFSTHIKYLAQNAQIDLTLDASMCPIFHTAPSDVIRRFVPKGNVSLLDSLPVDRADYDLIFDPYDWLSEMFNLKPQNDSSAVSVVSGLEFGRCCLNGKRRDILDMHMGTLNRLGLISIREELPEFVRFRITDEERTSVRERTRAKLLEHIERKNSAKIISMFPFGLSTDRRYPIEFLQTLIHTLLHDPDIVVVICGNSYDTPEMAIAIRSEWHGVAQPCRHRIKFFSEEPLSGLIDIMLASDLVVSMDSGPLHIARSLRINPIGLYTGKVNDPQKLLSFPWLVEDGTAEVLKPLPEEDHVFPDRLITAIQKRISLAGTMR